MGLTYTWLAACLKDLGKFSTLKGFNPHESCIAVERRRSRSVPRSRGPRGHRSAEESDEAHVGGVEAFEGLYEGLADVVIPIPSEEEVVDYSSGDDTDLRLSPSVDSPTEDLMIISPFPTQEPTAATLRDMTSKTVGEWSSLVGAAQVGTLASPRPQVIELINPPIKTAIQMEEEKEEDALIKEGASIQEESIGQRDEASIQEEAPISEEESPISEEEVSIQEE
ncbi:uncharacterized protein A4U43_C08F15970 [Asparagus officinalis]|nr:uncharacterized protein A4U43_C08F15970 [Asparagus officinalis]